MRSVEVRDGRETRPITSGVLIFVPIPLSAASPGWIIIRVSSVASLLSVLGSKSLLDPHKSVEDRTVEIAYTHVERDVRSNLNAVYLGILLRNLAPRNPR